MIRWLEARPRDGLWQARGVLTVTGGHARAGHINPVRSVRCGKAVSEDCLDGEGLGSKVRMGERWKWRRFSSRHNVALMSTEEKTGWERHDKDCNGMVIARLVDGGWRLVVE